MSQGSATWSDLTGKIRVSTISWCTRDWEHGESKGASQASHWLLCLITPTFWVTLSSKVNPTLQKPWMLIRLNVSVPYFSTIGVTAASLLLLFPRNAVSYPYLDSRSLHQRQPRRPSLDKRSLVSNHCTDITHCRTMFGVTLSPLPRCTRRSSRAPGSPSIQIFHAQRCERRTVGMEYGYEIHCCRPAVHMCLASTRVRAGYGSKTILESLGNSQVVKVLIFCSERRWSPRDPVLLIFIFRLYLEEYCILNSGGHFGLAFTSLKTLTRFRVCNFPVWHLPYRFLSLYKLLPLSRELYRWHQAILTADTKTRMQQSDTLCRYLQTRALIEDGSEKSDPTDSDSTVNATVQKEPLYCKWFISSHSSQSHLM